MKIPWELEKKDFITVICCFTCLFLATFNIVSVSSNLGSIQDTFGVNYSAVSSFSQILAVSYVIFFMVAIAFTDKLGKKVSIITGLSIFAVTSVLCAFAWNMESLTFFRLLTGIGISLIQASCNSIVTDVTQKKYLGDAMAIGYSFSSIGAILAPLIGFNIVNAIGIWIIFIMAVPICLILIYLLRNIDNVKARPDLKVNYPFHILYIISVTMMIGAMMNVSSSVRFILLSVGAAMFILAVIVHWKSKDKVFNGALFRNRTFMICLLLIFLYQYSMNGAENTISQFFQMNDIEFDISGIVITSAAFAAFLMSFKPFIQAISAPFIAKYYRNRDQSVQSIIGLVLLLISSVAIAIMCNMGKSTLTVFIILVVYLMHALASSFFTPYNKKILMSSVPAEDRNTSSALSAAIGTLASIFGVITLVNILNEGDTKESFIASANVVFAIVLIVSVASLILAAMARKRLRVQN